jgi:hypothetical protein
MHVLAVAAVDQRQADDMVAVAHRQQGGTRGADGMAAGGNVPGYAA